MYICSYVIWRKADFIFTPTFRKALKCTKLPYGLRSLKQKAMQVLIDITGHNGLHTFRIARLCMVMVIVSYQNFRCSAQEVEVGLVIYQSGRGGDGGGSCGVASGRVGGGR